MSEKRQGTAQNTCKKMQHRYGDGLYHKHNKHHLSYRQHLRTHPVSVPDDLETEALHGQEGMLKMIKHQKTRTRNKHGAY